ncbi:MAG: hypothetical protein RIS28_636 [Bacteroidota bacterium]
MKHMKNWVLGCALGLLSLGFQSCEDPIEPPVVVVQDKPTVELNFSALWDSKPLTFLSGWFEQPSTQKEYIQFFNFGMIVSKLSLVKEDGTEVLLGDGYQWMKYLLGNISR